MNKGNHSMLLGTYSGEPSHVIQSRLSPVRSSPVCSFGWLVGIFIHVSMTITQKDWINDDLIH